MIINNVINKKIDNTGDIRLFFQVDAENGYKAGVITFDVMDINNEPVAKHRRRLVTAKAPFAGHFFFDIKEAEFEKFVWFKWVFTTLALKKTTGGDVKAEKFEDLTDLSYVELHQKKLDGVLN